jgi:hypothetical protein
MTALHFFIEVSRFPVQCLVPGFDSRQGFSVPPLWLVRLYNSSRLDLSLPGVKSCGDLRSLSSFPYPLTLWLGTGLNFIDWVSLYLWNPKVQYRVHKRPPLVPILSHTHPIPSIPSCLSKIHFNIVHPPTSWSSQWYTVIIQIESRKLCF